jgi:uncharacterized repeat protein (TIGR03833 family)
MIDHIGKNRSEITIGVRVKVVQKQDQRTGTLTEGVVRDILTKSSHHPHGIKVRLESGIVGRVKEVMEIRRPLGRGMEEDRHADL